MCATACESRSTCFFKSPHTYSKRTQVGVPAGQGSHRTSSSTSGFWGPGARSQAKGPVLQAPPPGLVFSRREAA